MDSEFDPKEALAMAAQTRARLAARAGTPAWYAPGYGLGCGSTVVSLALPDSWIPAGMVLALVWTVGLYLLWQRISGLSVSGYRAGSTRRVTAWLLVAYMLAFAVAAGLRSGPAPVWGPILCGVALGLFAAWASAAWDRAWRRDMVREL